MKTKLIVAGLVLMLLFASVGAVFAGDGNPGKGGRRGAGDSIAPAASGTPKPEVRGSDKNAQKLADKYGVTLAQMQAWKEQGLGWGEIGKAYALAAAAEVDVSTLFARAAAGEGWGYIAHSLGYKVKGGGVNTRVVPFTKPKATDTPDD